MKAVYWWFPPELQALTARLFAVWQTMEEFADETNDPLIVHRIWKVCDIADADVWATLAVEIANGISPDLALRVSAAMHDWELGPCGLVSAASSAVKCHHKCKRCGIRAYCCAEQGCYHFYEYEGIGWQMPHCERKP